MTVLDEASSRLDPATATLLEKAIDRLLYNRSAIIIAHRLETVERADQVLILENGSAREYGSYNILKEQADSVLAGLLRAATTEVPA